jgi:hypothetical protein
MIPCDHVQNLFDAYLNDEISAAQASEVDAHCLKCESCRKQLRLMEACGNVIRLDTSEPQLSNDFTSRLVNIIEQEPAVFGLQLHRRMKIAAALLGAAATIALFGFFGRQMWVGEVDPARPDIASQNTVPQDHTSAPVSLIGDYIGLPLDRVLGVSEGLPGAAQLGQMTLNKLNDAANADMQPLDLFPGAQWPATDDPGPEPPLPSVDDGGELM